MWRAIHIELASMKTIQMTIDQKLLSSVDHFTRVRKTTRSAFIRTAIEAELRRNRVSELEARHAAGYAEKPIVPGEFDHWFDQQVWGSL